MRRSNQFTGFKVCKAREMDFAFGDKGIKLEMRFFFLKTRRERSLGGIAQHRYDVFRQRECRRIELC